MLKSGLAPLLTFFLALQSTAAQSTFTNPVIYGDYPDNDISTGPDGAFYFSASNFHYSPGAPILRSYDLVNWEPIGHSIPRLNFGDGYDLPPATTPGGTGARSYRGGTWASSMRYRKSNKTWYWIGCVNFWQTWIYTASSPEGPWSNRADLGQENCMYDNGLMIDDDDSMYVVFGNGQIKVAQLSADGFKQGRTENVFKASDVGADSMEGNRMYKVNGTYYILNDRPGGTTYVWKSKSPFGPYTSKILVDNVASPVDGGNSPHQGSLIQAADGKWYYMSFTWAYPSGRLPVLAPITWGADGFPSFVKGSNGGWGKSYPLPLPARPLSKWTGVYKFEGPNLGPRFEWNHNPDTSRFTVSNGLTLRTASVTQDLYSARNTLTHRLHGENPVGTVELDFTAMADGDRSGLAAFRDRSAYIAIQRQGSTYNIVAAHNMTIDSVSGAPQDSGRVVGTAPVNNGVKKMWLQAKMDARPNGSRAANFLYSYDGKTFVPLGGTYELYADWQFFMGYRFGIFNHATQALGGSVTVKSFTTV
jgi:beta-xylosidase